MTNNSKLRYLLATSVTVLLITPALAWASSSTERLHLQHLQNRGVLECAFKREPSSNVFEDVLGSQREEVCIMQKMDLFKSQCSSNDSRSCYYYAVNIDPAYNEFSLYSNLEAKSSYRVAVSYYKKGCDLGLPYACSRFGKYTLEGKGTRQDESLGISILERACNSSAGEACMTLGEHYSNESIGANPVSEMYYRKKAAGYYGKACDLGWEEGCTNYSIYK